MEMAVKNSVITIIKILPNLSTRNPQPSLPVAPPIRRIIRSHPTFSGEIPLSTNKNGM